MTKQANNQPTAALIVIGNEILSGRTHDKNIPVLASNLGSIGVALRDVRIVPDVEAEIIAAVNALRTRFSYVFTTGGIGPTHDDITAAAVAKAFARPFIRNPEAVALLEQHYRERDIEVTDARLSMADMPEGAELITNYVSGAPGFRVENVYVLAGVPAIMADMLQNLLPTLEGGPKTENRSIRTNLVESEIAALLADVESRYDAVEIGSYPHFNPRAAQFWVDLVLRSTEVTQLKSATQEVQEGLHKLGGEARLLDPLP